MIQDLPQSIRNAIYEIYSLAARGRISNKHADELKDMIEQKYLKAEWQAARRAGRVTLSTKAFSNRVDRLRRKGIKVMEGPGSRFRAYVAVWNQDRDRHGATFAPGSCNNLDEFAHRGKILFNHKPGHTIGIPFSAENDHYGLLVKGRFLNTELGRTMRTVIRERLEWGKSAPASLCLRTPCDDGVHIAEVSGDPWNIVTDFHLSNECSYVDDPAHPLATFF